MHKIIFYANQASMAVRFFQNDHLPKVNHHLSKAAVVLGAETGASQRWKARLWLGNTFPVGGGSFLHLFPEGGVEAGQAVKAHLKGNGGDGLLP